MIRIELIYRDGFWYSDPDVDGQVTDPFATAADAVRAALAREADTLDAQAADLGRQIAALQAQAEELRRLT